MGARPPGALPEPAWQSSMVQTQATLLAYIDVFVALGLIAVVMVPLALTLRKVNRSAGAKPAQ
jgi:MFS transporter, DHA2 family, multidrug resistance protein